MPLKNLLDWLYPPTCIACRKLIPLNHKQPRDMRLCEMCQTLFEPIIPPTCNTCGIPTEKEVERCVSCYGKDFHFTTNRGTFLYDELMRDLLLELKFKQNKQIAHSLGKLWAMHIADANVSVKQTAVFAKQKLALQAHAYEHSIFLVPLPMHLKKQRERGFNQAEILTQHLSSRLGIPIEHALLRTVDTPPQSGLHPRQRIENVSGVFEVAKGALPQGKNYIIIDDIYTTGASLNECAKVLKKAGAAGVSCMTLSVVEKSERK